MQLPVLLSFSSSFSFSLCLEKLFKLSICLFKAFTGQNRRNLYKAADTVVPFLLFLL
jgi:hypothetical protein